jgi:hypothetical protein
VTKAGTHSAGAVQLDVDLAERATRLRHQLAQLKTLDDPYLRDAIEQLCAVLLRLLEPRDQPEYFPDHDPDQG